MHMESPFGCLEILKQVSGISKDGRFLKKKKPSGSFGMLTRDREFAYVLAYRVAVMGA